MTNDALSIPERQTLADLESTIERNLQSFVEAGNALSEIRDRRLYRGTDSTFEAYCQRKWQFSRQRAQQLIDSAEVIVRVAGPEVSTIVDSGTDAEGTGREIGMSTMVDTPKAPESERHARELAKAPPEKQKATWKKVVATAPKGKDGKPKVTAKHVKKVVEEEAATANPGPRPATPEPEDLPTDKAGNPIFDKGIAEAFANAARIDRALDLLRQVKAEVNPLLGDGKGKAPIPGGEELAAIRQDLLRSLDNARESIRFGRPFAVCPYPHSKGQCPACKGLGWLIEDKWDRVPANLKANAGKVGAA